MSYSTEALSPISSLQSFNCDDLKVNLFREESVSDEKLATFLRIRPLDNLCLEDSPYEIIDSNLLSVDLIDKDFIPQHRKKAKKRIVKFTEIFDSSSGQETVFNKCCLPLINEVITGTNALLFCFGTTSSGKSYTMRGPPDDPTSDPGLIPLSLKKLFELLRFIDTPLIGKSKFCDTFLLDQDQQQIEIDFKASILSSSSCKSISAFSDADTSDYISEDGYEYICYLSYFEIYNGFIYDLLVPTAGGRGPALSIYPDDKQRYFVKDLKSVMASSLTEALQIYSFGWTNLQRNIQETGLNKNSSRSHSFLCISLIKFKEEQGVLLESQVSHLTFGDLAGSERQNKTHSEGLRVKEGGNINVSLMHLKECFNQTKASQKNPAKNTIIQFRNSSLTKFFQPYLTGTGRVWMIININPSPSLLPETLGSLDFGETASHISVNSTYHAEESKRRITQLWLKSSQRWSSFADGSRIPAIPEVVIEEDADMKMVPQDADEIKKEIESQILKEVSEEVDKIYAELQRKHEEDLQSTIENYERTMEARLALQERRLQKVIDELQEEVSHLAAENSEIKDAKGKLEEELKSSEATIAKKFEEEIITLQNELTSVKDAKEKVEEELASTETQFKKEIISLQNELKGVKDAKAKLEEEMKENEVKIAEKFKQEIISLQAELSSVKDAKEKLEEDLQSTIDNHERTMEERLALQERRLQKVIDELQEEVSRLTAENSEIKDAKGKLEKELKSSEATIAKKFEEEIKTLQNELTSVKAEREKLQDELRATETTIADKLKQEIINLQTELSSVKDAKEKLEEDLQSTIDKYEGILLIKLASFKDAKAKAEEELESKLASEQKRMQKLLEEYHEKVSQKVSYHAELIEVEDAKAKLEEELKAATEKSEQEIVALQNELAGVKEEKEKLQNELKAAEAKIVSLSENRDLQSQASLAPKSTFDVTDKLASARKGSREITIDSNYLPEVSGWTKKKTATESVSSSPSTDVTTAYLKRFQAQSTAKKSATKAAKKPTRKSTRGNQSKVSKTSVKSDVADESDDELVSLLRSTTKPKKKKTKDDEDENIPVKQFKLPKDDGLLDFLSSYFEDEPAQNIKGGRVLRPRRQIKF